MVYICNILNRLKDLVWRYRTLNGNNKIRSFVIRSISRREGAKFCRAPSLAMSIVPPPHQHVAFPVRTGYEAEQRFIWQDKVPCKI